MREGLTVDTMTRAAVLVIEDEPLLRMMAVDLVEDAGFEAIEAWDVSEALRILESRDDIRVIFSDVDLGTGGDGLELVHAARRGWPPIGVIIVSGKRRIERHQLPPDGLFFEKPYRRDQVTAAMHRLAA